MKNKLFAFRAACVMMISVICGIFVGCEPMPENKPEFSVSYMDVTPGYVTVSASVSTPLEVAYMCRETELPIEDASIIFISGKHMKVYESGPVDVLADLKDETEYHLYMVAKLTAKEYSQVYHLTFTTPKFEYDQLCTVVATMPDGFKMHFKMPESVRNSVPGTAGSRGIRYTSTDIMTYNTMRQKYDEYWMLLTNAGRAVTEDVTLEFSDATNSMVGNTDMNEDGVVNEYDETFVWNPVSPGEPIVFLAGEFEWMELPEEYQGKDSPNYVVDGWEYPAGWSAGYYLPMIDGEKYDEFYGLNKTKSIGAYNSIDISSEIDGLWTGAYQKKLFRSQLPIEFNGEVDVELLKVGVVDATIRFTPSENVLFYCACVLDEGTYQEMMKLLDNKEELLQWATASYFAMYNMGVMQFEGPKNVVLSDIFRIVPAETRFHVLVTGMGSENGLEQCFTHYTFSTNPKKKPGRGPEIVVTPLQEESSPFEAKYHIKCTSTSDNPVVKCFYGANYYRDWIYAINKGGTYYEYGQQAQFTEDEIEKINSEEGLTISIPTIDGETTRLVVVGFNDENTSNDLEYEDMNDCPAVADVTTPHYKADFCEAYLDMLDILPGDWTMSATVIADDGKRAPLTKNVSILGEYKDYPDQLTDEAYAIYKKHTKWTDEEIYAYYDEFLATAKKFNTSRLNNQNKLMLMGWLDGGVKGAYETMTPYDIFVSETINAVDVPSIFNDFGPKMFIEVLEDKETGNPKLTITADMYMGSPVMNWSDPFYMAGYADLETNNTIFYYSNEKGYYSAPLVFDVLLSDDKNTITIKAIERNGVKYYPNVIGQESMTGRYLLNNPIVSDVVLTRGHSAAASSAVGKSSRRSFVSPVTEALAISRKSMTRLERPAEVPTVEMEVMTLDKVHANMDNYVRLMNNKFK